ncbi:MAG: zinc ribbon domain-containing protein [Candidatus Dormibacteria bacterium]|jgi:putative FmdB family regulatory protein
MPTYEFECRDCSKRFEIVTSIHEHDKLRNEPPACPECGKRETRQLASLFSCKVAKPGF